MSIRLYAKINRNFKGGIDNGMIEYNCDIPWYIYSSRGNPLSLMSSMHLWATLGCGMFSCHGNLVWLVRGALDAPSVKSVAYHALCA